jgi:hypothetical protein
MQQQIPGYIEKAAIKGAPVKYKWTTDISLKFYAAKDQNLKLSNAIRESNFKAKMAIGLAVTEWIAWRFDGILPVKDACQRTEAGWASVIDPAYAKPLTFELSRGIHDKEPAKGAMEVALAVLYIMSGRYQKGSIYLGESVTRQVVLAEYLIPNREAFRDWLSSSLRRAAQLFPRKVEYDRNTGIYDASHETPVPREFFEPGFEYSEAAAHEAWKRFLRTLRPAENFYLRTPEELKAEGFKGTPYVL